MIEAKVDAGVVFLGETDDYNNCLVMLLSQVPEAISALQSLLPQLPMEAK